MTIKERVFGTISISQDNVKGKILSRSLLWMGLGLSVIVLVAYLTSTFSIFESMMLRIVFNNNWIIMLVLNLVLMFGLMFTVNNKNISIIIPATLYSIFSLYEGVFISGMLYLSGSLSVSKLLLLMLIPAFIFGAMGALAYFNLFDFSKIQPFLIFSSFMLMIVGISLIFFPNDTMEKIYIFFGILIFIGWIGFDIQMIKRAEERFETLNGLSDEQQIKIAINRLSLMFGISLFVDFTYILINIIRIFGRN